MDKDRIRLQLNKIFVLAFMAIVSLIMFVMNADIIGAVAHADYTPVVTVDSKIVHRGQTFNIDVDLTDNEGLISLYLTLDYDSSAMKLVNAEQGVALNSLTFTHTNTQTEVGYGILPFNMLWDGKTSDNSNGNLLRLTFESFSTAETGVYPITLTYDEANTNSDYGQPIEIGIVNGSVNLIKGEFEAVYYDWDGTELYRKDYNADDVPSYVGELPTRETDECYSYEFIGWKGIVSEDINVIKYQADYKLTPIVYQVFYYVDGAQEDSFDGIVTADDYYKALEIPYGTFLENAYPVKNRYVFSGWFKDDKCTIPFTDNFMPAKNLSLYGYFVYDIRTTSIPKIQMSMIENDDNTITVNANMVLNTGFNGMVLTLGYDRTALEFIGFEKKDTFSSLQFDTTDIETAAGYDVDNFKFYYEHSENTYETGSFLALKFKIRDNSKVGIYGVTFTLGNTDATYINGINGIRYTEIEILGVQIPVGKIYQWERSAEDDANITVTSDEGMPSDTTLKVSLVPESKHNIDGKTVEEIAGNDMELKAVYNIRLLRTIGNVEVEVEPNGTLTVEIKLTASQQALTHLSLYYVNDNGEMILISCERDGDVLRFKTDHLSWWAIVGDKTVVGGKVSDAMVMLITMPIMLAVATMAYALIVIGKNKKKKGEIDR